MLFRRGMKMKEDQPVGWHHTRSQLVFFKMGMRTYLPAQIYINAWHSRHCLYVDLGTREIASTSTLGIRDTASTSTLGTRDTPGCTNIQCA
jgi:hypothetical protein